MSKRKLLYEKRKKKCIKLGICYKCSKSKNNNKLQCDDCLTKHRHKNQKLRTRRAASNFCNCGQPSLPNRRLCVICTKRSRITQSNLRNDYSQNNTCVTCGKPQKSGSSTCQKCITTATNNTLRRYKINKENHVCPYCGKELNNKFRCDNCHINHLKYHRIYHQQQRTIILEHYGNICICCGETTNEFLEIDHINNDGNEHRKKIHNSTSNYRWIINNNFPTDLQILCANCNRGKARFKSCPHDRITIPITKHQKRRYKYIIKYGEKCLCCGENNWTFLEFDHINNDGNEHRKIIKNNLFKWIADNDFPNNIQLLCSNCNKAKRLYGKCPHQRI